jgi:ubiquinone/menaquinone biosynthesis C-methylase UbiE
MRKIAHAGFEPLARLGSRFGSPRQKLDEVTGVSNLFTREAVRVFTTLGLPDLIASDISDIAELAEKLEVNEDALARVANHLVGAGILASPGSGKITLTAVGELLRSDHPENQNVYFQLEGAPARMEAAQRDLLFSVRTGKPAYAHANGAEMWDQMARQPILTASFDAMMAEHARRIGPAFAENYDWQGISQVADVGGGTGELLGQILRRIPSMRGIVVEYADAAIRARKNMEKFGLSDRCRTVQCDFLEDALPQGADAYILSWILHNWDDKHAKSILENCRSAAGTDGRLLVVERPFDLTNDTYADLNMLTFFGGRERTREELEALSRSAGFRPTSWTDITAGCWVMECVAA